MPIFRYNSRVLAHDDNNFPKKFFDWDRQDALTVRSPTSRPVELAPGETLIVFSGTRSTTVAADTQFTLSLSPLSSGRYRLAWTAGTDPSLRANRGVNLVGHQVTVTGNSNGTANFTSNTSGAFTAVQVGDRIYVPGVRTGDSASVFDELNCGFWEVLGKTGSTVLQARRPVGSSYEALGQTVTVASQGQFVVYAAAGVQVGDGFDISAGFSAPLLSTWMVAEVVPGWVEFLATSALPTSEVATPGAAGIVFYTGAVRWLRVESDGEVVVRINGDSASVRRATPLAPGVPGWFEVAGPVWALTLYNRTTVAVNARVFSVA